MTEIGDVDVLLRALDFLWWRARAVEPHLLNAARVLLLVRRQLLSANPCDAPSSPSSGDKGLSFRPDDVFIYC